MKLTHVCDALMHSDVVFEADARGAFLKPPGPEQKRLGVRSALIQVQLLSSVCIRMFDVIFAVEGPCKTHKTILIFLSRA